MSNRFHLPVVVTTDSDVSKKEASEYVERILANLEESDEIYRVYVEDKGIDGAEAERLLDMLGSVDAENVDSAISTIESISKGDEENA